MFGLALVFAVSSVLTALWLGGVAVYVSHGSGWTGLLTLPPTDLAIFISAAAGPPVLLWLVAGWLQQGLLSRRLMIAVRLMATQNRRSAEALEAQGEALRTVVGPSGAASEASPRNQTDTVGAVRLGLADLTAQLAVLAERLGVIDQDEAAVLWNRAGQGDLWGFAYAFLSRAAIYPEFPQLLAERLSTDPLGADTVGGFLHTADSLLEHSVPGTVAGAIVEGGPLPRLGALLRQVEKLTRSLPPPRKEEGLGLGMVAEDPFAGHGHPGDDSDPFHGMSTAAVDGLALRDGAARATLGDRLGRESEGAEPPAATVAAPAAAEQGEAIEVSLARLQDALRKMNDGDASAIPDQLDSVADQDTEVGPIPSPDLVLGAAPRPTTTKPNP